MNEASRAAAVRPQPALREDYVVFRAIPTRWMDNDVYGHVNNVVYYSWFDTAVNAALMEAGLLDFEHGEIVGVVVETSCSYFESIAFPEVVEVGVRVAQIGRSSVRYEVGIFRKGASVAAAQGSFVHVYVDRGARRPVVLPDDWRHALEAFRRG
jgi:acyl-CoA thioester hydrolase